MDSNPRPSYEVADRQLLRRHLGAFATGVTIITVGGASPHGMTANAFTSVSLDPPLLLICVEREAIMHRSLISAGVFGISVLSAGQEDIARHFANRARPLGWAQFDVVDCTPGPATGAPMIDGAVAQFECRLWRTYEGGDHTIFVGNLMSMDRGQDPGALIFCHGTFHHLLEQTEVTS